MKEARWIDLHQMHLSTAVAALELLAKSAFDDGAPVVAGQLRAAELILRSMIPGTADQNGSPRGDPVRAAGPIRPPGMNPLRFVRLFGFHRR